MKAHHAVLVGAGRIGAGFDGPQTKEILTHAHALSSNRSTKLTGLFDTDAIVAHREATKWKIPGWNDFEAMMSATRPEVVSLCVPDRFHSEYLRACLKWKPKLVLAEKPLTTSIEESERLVEEYERNGILCSVNYSRRFAPGWLDIRERFLAGEWGNALLVHAIYGKGTLHNGSHVVDTLRWFFGEPTKSEVTESLDSSESDDPTLGFHLECPRCQRIVVSPFDEKQYTVFEIHMYFERAKFSFVRGGISVQQTLVESDPLFEGYRDLIRPTSKSTALDRSMQFYLQNSLAALHGGGNLRSSMKSALETQRVCTDLVHQWRNQNG